MIKLSVCIPTYNRAIFLSKALESIISQVSATDAVEIVVSDNASEDETHSVISTWAKHYSNLIYFRWNSNQGGDRNLMKVIELARGEFCWYLGDDDAFTYGALGRILQELESDADIYQCNRLECTFHLEPQFKRYWWKKGLGDLLYDFSKEGALEAYFKTCLSAGGLYSFLSTIGFRRKKWIEAGFDSSYLGSAYPHLYPLMKMMLSGCRLKTIQDHLILYRTGQDSYTQKSRAVRVNWDVETYLRIADQLFIDSSSCREAFLSPVRSDVLATHIYSIKNICYIKRCSKKNDWNKLYCSLRRLYGNRFDLNLVHYLPVWFVRLLLLPRKFLKIFLKIGKRSRIDSEAFNRDLLDDNLVG